MDASRDVLSDPRMHFNVALAAVGVGAFVLGLHPEWFGLATTPEVGFLQIVFMVTGMGVYTGAAIAALRLLWHGRRWSVVAQIGARLMATGYVAFAASVMADILGLGSQTWPMTAHFGPVQHYGMLVGEGVMALGVVLMYPYHRYAKEGKDDEARVAGF